VAFCGSCGARLYLTGRRADSSTYGRTARVRGIPAMSYPDTAEQAARNVSRLWIADLNDAAPIQLDRKERMITIYHPNPAILENSQGA
jgi:hypothetical protein